MKLQVLTLQNRKPRTQDKEHTALAHALPHHVSPLDRKGQSMYRTQSSPTALAQGQRRDLTQGLVELSPVTLWLAWPTGGTERKQLGLGYGLHYYGYS